MFAARFAAVTAATLLTGAAIAALTVANPFQDGPSPKVKQHDVILQGAGEWAGTITVHNPQMPEPMVSECTESVHAIGNLWTVADFKSQFGPMKFHGSSTMGYDTEKEMFVATWVDSTTTSFTHMEGEYDEERGGIVLNYESKNPMTGETSDALMVLSGDKNNSVTHFYTVEDGEETLTMVIEMKRKKTVEASAEKAEEALQPVGSDDDEDQSDEDSDE